MAIAIARAQRSIQGMTAVVGPTQDRRGFRLPTPVLKECSSIAKQGAELSLPISHFEEFPLRVRRVQSQLFPVGMDPKGDCAPVSLLTLHRAHPVLTRHRRTQSFDLDIRERSGTVRNCQTLVFGIKIDVDRCIGENPLPETFTMTVGGPPFGEREIDCPKQTEAAKNTARKAIIHKGFWSDMGSHFLG